MSALFNRQLSLIVADSSGKGLELSGNNNPNEGQPGTQPLTPGFHIVFTVTHWTVDTPNNLALRIYNLNDQTATQIRKEFTQIVLRAGYPGNFGIIFQGTIKHVAKGAVAGDISDLDDVRSGNETARDTYLDIFAAEGDEAYNFGIINQTLAAGYTPEMVNQAIGAAMGAATSPATNYGVPWSTKPLPATVPQRPAPRGRVLYGMARSHARVLARSNGLDWAIQGGALQWLPQSAYLPGAAIVLNSKTGLIGVPTQTEEGLAVRSLLDPALGPGQRIQIANKLIQAAAPDQSFTALNTLPSIAADGFYKILYVDHSGDTRGNDWYSDMICLAVDGTILPVTSGVLGVPIPP
jgi:hypothetical protein